MIIANEKRKNNIAEYILYMWQIEDIIRSNSLNLDRVKKTIIEAYDVPLSQKLEIENWYARLIKAMKEEGIEEKGHLSMLKTYIDQLEKLHHLLLTVNQDKDYQDLYHAAKSDIDALILKSNGNVKSEVEACLTGLYGLMVLKLKKADVSAETLAAMRSFSKMMAYLAKSFHKGDVSGNVLSGERKN